MRRDRAAAFAGRGISAATVCAGAAILDATRPDPQAVLPAGTGWSAHTWHLADPARVLLAGAWLAAAATVTWIAVSLLLVFLADLLHAPVAVRTAARRLLPGVLRRVVPLAGAGMLAMAGPVSASAPAPAGSTPPPALRALDPGPAVPSGEHAPRPPGAPGSPGPPELVARSVAGSEAPTPGPATPVHAPSPGEVWRVQPGEHLWAIAEAHLAGTHGRAPSDRAVAAYVRRLADANRDRLADPRRPDLVHPGQEFVLPPVAEA